MLLLGKVVKSMANPSVYLSTCQPPEVHRASIHHHCHIVQCYQWTSISLYFVSHRVWRLIHDCHITWTSLMNTLGLQAPSWCTSCLCLQDYCKWFSPFSLYSQHPGIPPCLKYSWFSHVHMLFLLGRHISMYPLAKLIFSSQIICQFFGRVSHVFHFKSCPCIDLLFDRTLFFPLIRFCSILNYVGFLSITLPSLSRMLCPAWKINCFCFFFSLWFTWQWFNTHIY